LQSWIDTVSLLCKSHLRQWCLKGIHLILFKLHLPHLLNALHHLLLIHNRTTSLEINNLTLVIVFLFDLILLHLCRLFGCLLYVLILLLKFHLDFFAGCHDWQYHLLLLATLGVHFEPLVI